MGTDKSAQAMFKCRSTGTLIGILDSMHWANANAVQHFLVMTVCILQCSGSSHKWILLGTSDQLSACWIHHYPSIAEDSLEQVIFHLTTLQKVPIVILHHSYFIDYGEPYENGTMHLVVLLSEVSAQSEIISKNANLNGAWPARALL